MIGGIVISFISKSLYPLVLRTVATTVPQQSRPEAAGLPRSPRSHGTRTPENTATMRTLGADGTNRCVVGGQLGNKGIVDPFAPKTSFLETLGLHFDTLGEHFDALGATRGTLWEKGCILEHRRETTVHFCIHVGTKIKNITEHTKK